MYHLLGILSNLSGLCLSWSYRRERGSKWSDTALIPGRRWRTRWRCRGWSVFTWKRQDKMKRLI